MKLSTIVQTAFAAAALAASGRDVPVSLSNVDFTEDMTDESITVTYNLANEGDEPACVQLDILTNGVSIGRDKLKTLSGDVSGALTNFVSPGLNKKITWQARKDWKGHVSSQAVACVSAYYTNSIAAIPGIYMVIDLSGGPNAKNYPVSYSLTAPDVLADSSCASNKLWLRHIDAGTFEMGLPTDLRGTLASSDQVGHSVTITKSFFINVYKLTRAQMLLLTGTDTSNCGTNSLLAPAYGASYDDMRGSVADGINWPVTGTNVASESILGKLRARTGILFDLPTEAQWEYACRSGSIRDQWNDGSPRLSDTEDANLRLLGWYRDTSQGASGLVAHPVGLKKPNNWGLYDMHGDGWEFTCDWHVANTNTLLWAAQVGERGYDGPESSPDNTRVIRAGGYNSSVACQCRSSFRNQKNPATSGGTFRFVTVVP